MAPRQGSYPATAPRALAELRLDSSPARREEIARRWIVALVGSRAPADLGRLPLGRLADGAPQLIGALLDALRSDGALGRLRSGSGADGGDAAPGADGVGELVGARTTAELVDALEPLRGVLSEALLEELTAPSARQTADVCERVAHVCTSLLAGATPPGETAIQAGGGRGRPDDRAAPAPERSEAPPEPALIVDELEDVPRALGSHDGREAREAIAIRDRRGEHAPAEWLEAIARELERHEPQELPFAVLLVEFGDLERLRLQSTPARLAADLESLERALSANGRVIRERPGRYWVLAPGADRHGARALAERMHAAVASAAGDEPLRALIGLAVYPADGRHAAALAAHADVDLIAARAARR